MPDLNRRKGEPASFRADAPRFSRSEIKMKENPAANGMAEVVQRNIQALLKRRRSENERKPRAVLVADAITRFAGSMKFIYIHLVLFSVWIVTNLSVVPLPHFDPTYVVLAMFASVEAIFLSTFVLISQNRMSQQADKRADLDLQVSLLAEHEVTRLITLVKAIAEKLDVEASRDPELPQLQQDVQPEKVLDVMETHQRNYPDTDT
ncbi:MAG: DUF1003 domain-containing protein [Chthoniobacterales bacterium]|nr:DUF1003 domain-containing protein [Chthoniobacterales bacterium]